MLCPFQTIKTTIKGMLKGYSHPKDIETVEFLDCSKDKCMAYKAGKCDMIKKQTDE